jgi:hypothetical protein
MKIGLPGVNPAAQMTIQIVKKVNQDSAICFNNLNHFAPMLYFIKKVEV